jgi:hypothetical protein
MHLPSAIERYQPDRIERACAAVGLRVGSIH